MSLRARRWLRRAAVLAGVLGLGYGLLLAAVWWRQEWLLFRPQTLPAEHRFELGADVHERWLEVPGGRLNALHLRQTDAKGLVFYLHGNGGSLQSWWPNLQTYRERSLDLLMLDYRGYGKSPCCIDSQAQLLADVRAAWAQVAPAYAGRPRILFGRSLGSGLATQLAASLPAAEQPQLLVLVSPYRSMLALKEEHYAWVPDALLRYPLRSDEALPRYAGPTLLLHGQRDSLIPYRHSEQLAALARKARLVLIPEAGHPDVHRFDAYRQALHQALDQAVGKALDPAVDQPLSRGPARSPP